MSSFRDSTLLIRELEVFTKECGGSAARLVEILSHRFGKPGFRVNLNKSNKVYRYFSDTVIPHKVAVYEAGMELLSHRAVRNLDFDTDEFKKNLLLHDLSKFSNIEAIGYGCYGRKTGVGKAGFERAWHHHKMNNPHHPEYWLNPNRGGKLELMPIPDLYIVEMIADWKAGEIYGKSIEDWLPDNFHTFLFHPDTLLRVKNISTKLGYL